MPGAYPYKSNERKIEYVRDVYSTILIRDLVQKYKIRSKQEFANIAEFMMDNIGNLLSPNKIAKTLNNSDREITSLLDIRDAYPKILIARTRHETYQYEGVQIIDICRWLSE